MNPFYTLNHPGANPLTPRALLEWCWAAGALWSRPLLSAWREAVMFVNLINRAIHPAGLGDGVPHDGLRGLDRGLLGLRGSPRQILPRSMPPFRWLFRSHLLIFFTFRVQGLGFRVYDLGLKIRGSGSGVDGLVFEFLG